MNTTLKTLFEISLYGGMKLDLATMHMMDAAFDFPSKSFHTVHVAGTNGKGSTAFKIGKSLHCNSRKVGLYTSPHISTVRERIEINGEMISFDAMEYHFVAISKLMSQEQRKPTFFEIMTMIAFLHFRENKVEWAVLEVGMGGRLDATNIVNPALSVITSIGFDHKPYLGNSLEAIAIEKGGIIKENVPVILGPLAAKCQVLHEMAHKKGCPLHIVEENFSNFEEENRAIAEKALDVLAMAADSEGLMKTPPCRFEEFISGEQKIILDVAHNPPAFEYLLKRLHKEFPQQSKAFLVGFSSDKDFKSILDLLIREASFIYLTKASHGRALTPNIAADYLRSKNYHNFHEESDIKKCFELALRHDFCVVAGTFYIMKEVREVLKIQEPHDPYSFLY